jgi:hypothetical protein
VEPDKPHNPIHIGTFGVNGVVVKAEHIPYFVEELG